MDTIANAAAAAAAAIRNNLESSLAAAAAAAADGQQDCSWRLAAIDSALALAQLAEIIAAVGGAAGIKDTRPDIGEALGDALVGICRSDAADLEGIGRQLAGRLAALLGTAAADAGHQRAGT